MSFADLKPTVKLRKGGPDATVSLAETPARVEVSSPLGQLASRPKIGGQSKTLFGVPAVSVPGQERAPGLGRGAAQVEASAVSQHDKPTTPIKPPRPSLQSKTLFGVPTVSMPAQDKAPPAEAPKGVEPTQEPVATAQPEPTPELPSVPEPVAEQPPVESVFAADTPTANLGAMQSAVTQRESQVQVRAQPTDETSRDEKWEVSLSEPSLAESAHAPEAPRMRASSELEELPIEMLERRNAPSTEPAPRPRSALSYGLWAAIPVGLCAAWFTWHMPASEPRMSDAAEVTLKADAKSGPSALPGPMAPSEPAQAPEAPVAEAPSTEAPAADAVNAEASAAAAAEPALPNAEATAVDPAAVEPGAAPEPEAQAADGDLDAEDADVELDAARKAVAVRADKLVNEGHALRKKKKLAPARAKYRDALVLYPGYPRALAGLVQVAILQHDGKAAVNLAKQLVKQRPTQVSYQVLLGDAYKVAGKPALAKEAWQGAARKGSSAAKARLGA